MTDQVAKFIIVIDNAEEELYIRTNRDKHRIEARTNSGKLYYYLTQSQL